MKSYLLDTGIEELDIARRLVAESFAAKVVLGEVADKLFQHLVKNWGVSPLATGAPRGNLSIGRGTVNRKAFDENWW